MNIYKKGDWVVVLDTPNVNKWPRGPLAIGKALQVDDYFPSLGCYTCGENKYGINYLERDLRRAKPYEVYGLREEKDMRIGGYVRFTKDTIYPGNCPAGTFGKLVDISDGLFQVKSLHSPSATTWAFPTSTKGLEWVGMEIPASESPKTEPDIKEPPIDLRNTKIWIGKNPDLSKRVQEKAFELGWSWFDRREPQYTEHASLFFYPDKRICYSTGDTSDDVKGTHFNTHKYREIYPQDLGIHDSIPKEEEKYTEGWYRITGPAEVKVVYAYLKGKTKGENSDTSIKVFSDGNEEIKDSYILTHLIKAPVTMQEVTEFIASKKPIEISRDKFLAGEYIVSLIDAADSAPKYWCVKQRADKPWICPVMDSKGSNLNLNSTLIAVNLNHWRFATEKEIEIYKKFGPFDTTNPPTSESIKSSEKEHKMETSLIKPGDKVTITRTATKEDWGKMGVASDFMGEDTVTRVESQHHDGRYYALLKNFGCWYPINCLAVVEDKTASYTPEEPLHTFQKGDLIRGTCPQGHPYSVTCEGWQGEVVALVGSKEMRVRGLSESGGPWLVESKYFKLAKSAEIKTDSGKYSHDDIVVLINNSTVSVNRIGDIGRISNVDSTNYQVATHRNITAGNWSRENDLRLANYEEKEAYFNGFVTLDEYRMKGKNPPSPPVAGTPVDTFNVYVGMKVQRATHWEWGSQGEGAKYGVVERIRTPWVDVRWIHDLKPGTSHCYRIEGILDLVVYDESLSPTGLVSMSENIRIIPLKDEIGASKLIKID